MFSASQLMKKEPPKVKSMIRFTEKHLLLKREQSTESEILETGIKVIDLLCPYQKGGKIGLFGGAGVGKTVLIQELITKHCYRARWIFRIYRCR